MMFLQKMRKSLSGFTLIELAIVLGVVGILTAGLWRIMATGGQQSKDQVTAQQQAALISAVKGFLSDTSNNSGQAWLLFLGTSQIKPIPLPQTNASLADCQTTSTPGHGYTGVANGVFFSNLCPYLSPGFTSATTNPYGQIYNIGVATGTTNPQQNYSFMIVTSGGTPIPDTDGGRISNLIGNEGGFVYTSAVCTGVPSTTMACGSQSAWSAPTTNYLFPAIGSSGSVASMSFVSSVTNGNYNWLARVAMPGDTTFSYNTMTTDMYMGNQTIHGNGPTGTNPQLDLEIPAVPVSTSPPVPITFLNAHCSLTNASFQASGGGPLPTCPSALQVTGDIAVAGEIQAISMYTSSDMRLKTNIRPIKNALGDLMKIDPVSFTFKAGGRQSMGVIAQEVEKIYPQLVSTGNNGTKSVEYNGLIGPLIGAVQELKRENDDLRAQLHAQSERLEKLEEKPAAP